MWGHQLYLWKTRTYVLKISPDQMKIKADQQIDCSPDVAFSRFKVGLGKVLAVSKSDLERMLAAEKRANAGKPKRGPKPRTSASAHASRDKD